MTTGRFNMDSGPPQERPERRGCADTGLFLVAMADIRDAASHGPRLRLVYRIGQIPRKNDQQ